MPALQRAASYLRGQVAREVELRYMPALSFEADQSFDQAARMDRLLRQVTAGGTTPPRPPDEDR